MSTKAVQSKETGEQMGRGATKSKLTRECMSMIANESKETGEQIGRRADGLESKGKKGNQRAYEYESR